VQKAVGPEVARRLGRLAQEADEAFAFEASGDVLWKGESAGTLFGGDPFKPSVRLHGELGPPLARERAARRLEAFVASEASRRLSSLKALADAVASGSLKGLARGIAYRLLENGGAMDRRGVETDLAHLSRGERRALRAVGVRFGQFAIRLERQPDAAPLAEAFARLAAPDWRPGGDGPIRLVTPPPPRALGLRSLIRVGGLAVTAESLDRLSEHLQSGRQEDGAFRLSEAHRQELGWTERQAQEILRGLGYVPMRGQKPGEAMCWRRRRSATSTPPAQHRPHSPFAALAALQPAAPHPPRRKRPRARRAHG
jgi:ATP-dependent RNA helicase SUPV3L1/SUV3